MGLLFVICINLAKPLLILIEVRPECAMNAFGVSWRGNEPCGQSVHAW